MSLNGGLGGVTIADERVQVPLYEGLSGTLHANKIDYWVMIADLEYPDNAGQINNFGVIEVTADGVEDIVWTSVGSFYLLNPTTEFSPDGKYFLSTRKLFSFDNATGEIEDLNIQFDPGGVPAAYGFSPNSRYVYYLMWAFQTETLTVSRYDLEATDILGSEQIIGTISNTFQSSQMQIGPDGNLYFAHFGGGISDSRISRIRCPNTDSPTIEESIFTFGWNDFPLYFSMGNYTDHVFKSDQDFTLNICPGDTTILCDGTLDFSVAIEGGTYLWSTGETTSEITIDEPGTYTLVANSFCGTASDTVVVLGPGATVEIVGDPSFCAGANTTLSLSGSGNYTSILWSTGETTESIDVDEAGTYSVTITDICDFIYESSIDVVVVDAPVVSSILISEDPCQGKTISLIPEYTGAGVSFLWSTGETTESINIDIADLYTVEVFNDCGSASAELEIDFGPCACDFSLPNAFSPNNDGLNDVFGLAFPCELIQSYELRIYNRWGQEVFFSENSETGWNGMTHEKANPEDVYVWMLKYQEIEKEEVLIQGELNLLR